MAKRHHRIRLHLCSGWQSIRIINTFVIRYEDATERARCGQVDHTPNSYLNSLLPVVLLLLLLLFVYYQRLEIEIELQWQSSRSKEEQDLVIDHSRGAVLYSGTLLKSNTYIDPLEPLERECQITEDVIITESQDSYQFPADSRANHKYRCFSIPGIPNYRKVDGFPVHGCGQPTIFAMKQLLKSIGAKKGKYVARQIHHF
jgi:hypothetical protein